MPLRDAIFVNTAVGAEPENGRAGQLLEAVKVLHKQVPPPMRLKNTRAALCAGTDWVVPGRC
jgi:hypothetical protein